MCVWYTLVYGLKWEEKFLSNHVTGTHKKKMEEWKRMARNGRFSLEKRMKLLHMERERK